MLFGLKAETKWLGTAKQHQSLIDFGVLEKDIYPKVKASKWRDDRDWIINKATRASTGDCIAVARLFVLATKTAELNEVITRAHTRQIAIVETDTGRRSDDLGHLLEMVRDASLAYAGKWISSERAAELSAMARKVAAPRKNGYMPATQVQRILNNHERTVPEALLVVNADERYPDKWSISRVYRAARGEIPGVELNLIRRHKGKGPGWV